MEYNAEKDAEKLSEPMRRWARIGFMRGFAGIRGEMLPRGKVSLPSAAFHAAATQGIDEVGEEEAARRRIYIAVVEARLREVQAESIHDHFMKAAWGQIADFGVGVLVVVLTVGLLVRVGPFEPITFAFLLLFALKLGFMQLSVRRFVKVAEEAFNHQADRVRLPWRNGAAH